jgi:hypothetical protein
VNAHVDSDFLEKNVSAPFHTRNVVTERQAPRARRELLKHLIAASLLVLTFVSQIGGGLTTSLPTLHPTHRITESRDDTTIHERSSRIGPSSSNLMPQTRQTGDADETSSIFDDNQVTNTSSSSPANSPRQNDCIDFTIAFLPSWIDESYPVQWSIYSDEVVWSKEYSDVALFNAIITDNAADDDTCLLPGSYSFNMSVAGEAQYKR